MDSQRVSLLTEIIPKYKGIYPPETIEAVYGFLKVRIESLTPIVETNEKAPLITEAEKEDYEEGVREEIERRFQKNGATKKTLDDCKAAWERLINGTAHLCTGCGFKINEDRKQAFPAAGKCKKCQEKTGLRVS